MVGHQLSQEQQSFFLDTTRRFMLCADSVQIQLAPDRFVGVCRKYKDIHVSLGTPRHVIVPLQSAVARLQPSANTLTPLHADLLQVCLVSKFYGIALSVVQQGLALEDPKRTGLTAKDFLLYCYYGGMVFLGEQMFADALDFFLNALTVPAVVLSSIMIESYKKYVLVCLLLHGKLDSIPKYTSQVVQRTIANQCMVYMEFAKAFSSHDMGKLNEVIAKYESVYDKDHNLGLVRQCCDSLRKFIVQRVTRTYLTISLEQLADVLKLDKKKTEKLLVRMIVSSSLSGKIDNSKGILILLHDEEDLLLPQGAIERAISVAEEVQKVDETLSHNRSYIQEMLR